MTVALSTCPDCTEAVPVPDGLRVTSIVVCPGCQVELEVIALDPPCLADTGLLHTIETAVSPADGCHLLDRQGMRLGW